MVEITITNEQKVNVSLTPVTATGKPAQLDGNPVWTVASGDATLDVANNGKSAFLVSSDLPGESVIVVEADADVGAGVETISDSIKLITQGAKAVNLGITLAAPVEK